MANKETALAAKIKYLEQNGYDLPIEDSLVKQAIYDHLMRMEFGKGDADAYDALDELLLKTVVRKK